MVGFGVTGGRVGARVRVGVGDGEGDGDGVSVGVGISVDVRVGEGKSPWRQVCHAMPPVKEPKKIAIDVRSALRERRNGSITGAV